jgi:hypothetical protein
MNRQSRMLTKECVFKFSWMMAIMGLALSAHAFEYQEYEKKIKTNYALTSAVEKIPRTQIEENLRSFIASGRPNRLVGSPGHKKSREYLENKLKAITSAGVTFRKDEFAIDGVDKEAIPGVNFIWEKKGVVKPDELMVLVANYDTLIKDPKTNKPILKGEMSGADNNGTGVATLLSMLEIFNRLDLPKSVRVVFLDGEEFEGQGSKAYAKSSELLSDKEKKRIFGVINLTMLGHDSRIGDKEQKLNNMKLYTRPKSQADYAQDEGLANFLINNGKRNYSSVTFTMAETDNTVSPMGFPETGAHFWEAGLPAVTFSENRESDLNPRYMTSNDFVETLNLNTYLNVFKYVTSAVLAWNYDIVK